MTVLKFSVRSSSTGSSYEIRVKAAGGTVTLTCTCPAAGNGYWCKHRVALLDGDMRNVVKGAEDDVNTLRVMVEGTALHKAYMEKIAADLLAVEAAEMVKRANRNLSRAMLGIPVEDD